MPKRVVTYARVSGDDRHTEGRNLQGQIEMCRQYATERGYEIVAELAEDDRGASGAAFELPQLDQVRQMARAGAFDVLVVRELDRLSRRLAKQLFVEEELRRLGIGIEYTKATYEETPEGNLMKNVRAVVAEYERLKIVERTTSARMRAVEAGSVMVHAFAPFGYRAVRNGPLIELVIEETEAAVVRLIFDWYLHGYNGGRPLTGEQIAAELTAREVLTAADKSAALHKRRAAGEWAPATVSHILRDETYAGMWHYRKIATVIEPDGRRRRYLRPPEELLGVAVPPIIDRGTWEATVQRRAHNKLMAGRNLQHADRYLLRGRVICGVCESRMQCAPASASNPRAYYRCPARQRSMHYVRRCSMRNFRVERVDERVWTWLRGLIEQPAVVEAGRTDLHAREEEDGGPLGAELSTVERDLRDVAVQKSRLLDAYMGGHVDNEEFAARSRKLQARHAQLAGRQQKLVAERAQAAELDQSLVDAVAFANDIAARLPESGDDSAFRRFVAEKLDVQAKLVEIDARRGMWVRCKLRPQPVLLLI